MRITTFLLFVTTVSALHAQQPKTKPTRQSSLEAFSGGNYEKAYSEFSELLSAYPRDPLYLYYTGVCLVRLQREPGKAVGYLKQAKQNSAQVRNVPSDVTYWLGRAQLYAGDYNDAIASFEDFTSEAGRKTAKELSVPELIEQCKSGKGKLELELTGSRSENTVNLKPDNNKTPESIPASPYRVKNTVLERPVVSKDSAAGISKDFDRALSEALDYQETADSLNRILDEREKQLDKLSYAKKVEERSVIENEKKVADSLQTLAMKKFDQAQATVNSTTFVSGKQVTRQTPDTLKSKIIEAKQIISEPEPAQVQKVAISKPAGNQTAAQDTLKRSSVKPSNQQPVFTVFEVKQAETGNAGNKIETNPDIPEGLIYRIQVAVFRNPVVTSYFKGITPVYGFRAPGKDVTIYYAGMFRRNSDAGKALTTVRQKGFKDAFITPLMDGKAVSAERAALLEKEWGVRPLFEIVSAEVAPADTTPPTLSFRVEVLRSPKPLNDEAMEGLKKSAGTRGLDAETLADGTIVYLIGRFITYESAEEYANLLLRNGYREAKVGAWLGKKEIPVETAKQIFEKIE